MKSEREIGGRTSCFGWVQSPRPEKIGALCVDNPVEELETVEEFGAVVVAVLEDLENEGPREVEVEVGRFGSLDLRETVDEVGTDEATDGIGRFDEEEGKALGLGSGGWLRRLDRL
ncbi:hypothetical protein LWI29_011450 [Acer saccharum]|uniref:Uncharacterized protein n=1 Tax=Acer saccharum TaxID=4024 RepID=A0AA39T626_ACESA|nr:hypothetical protein LWI29_011450 [Acer saccharum]